MPKGWSNHSSNLELIVKSRQGNLLRQRPVPVVVRNFQLVHRSGLPCGHASFTYLSPNRPGTPWPNLLLLAARPEPTLPFAGDFVVDAWPPTYSACRHPHLPWGWQGKPRNEKKSVDRALTPPVAEAPAAPACWEYQAVYCWYHLRARTAWQSPLAFKLVGPAAAIAHAVSYYPANPRTALHGKHQETADRFSNKKVFAR